jgi:separase
MNRDDIVSRLFNQDLPHLEVVGAFSNYFKALCEEPRVSSKLLSRKLAQTYGQPLLGVLNSASKELLKGGKKKRQETLLFLAGRSLELLHKVSEQACSLQDHWRNWVNFISKLHELHRHHELLERTAWLIPDLLALSPLPNELAFSALSLMVCRGSSLVQTSTTQGKLDEAFTLLSRTARQLIVSMNVVSTADHTALNKVYHNCFKLMFSVGKRMDCLAANNLVTHSKALAVRTESLEFCIKAKPFVASDFYAFVYSSSLAAYKVAQVHKKASFSMEVVQQIKTAMGLVEDFDLVADKNTRSLVDLAVHLSSKTEDYSTALDFLHRVLRQSPSCAEGALYCAKYMLEQANIKLSMKLEYHHDLTRAADFAAKALLTEPLSEDAQEVLGKLSQYLEMWLRKCSALHSSASISQPVQVEQITAFQAVLALYPPVCKLLKKSNELDLFYYIQGLHSLLLCPSSPEMFSHALISFPLSLPRYFKHIFNCSLALSSYDRESSFKLLQVLLEHLKKTPEAVNSSHTAVFELSCRLAVEFKNYFTHSKQVLTAYLRTQTTQRPLTELHQLEVNRLIELYHKLNFEYLRQALQADADLPDLDLLSLVGLVCPCPYKVGSFIRHEVHILHKALLQAEKTSPRLVSYYAQAIQTACEWLIFQSFPNSEAQKTRVLIDYINILALKPKAFEDERLLGLVTVPGHTLLQRMTDTVDLLCSYALHPTPFLWRGILSVQQIKQIEMSRESDWLSKESISLCKGAVESIKEGVRLSQMLLERTWKDEEDELEHQETLRMLLLVCDVCDLMQLYSCQATALKICLNFTKEEEACSLLKLRYALALEKVGDMTSAAELVDTLSPRLDCESPAFLSQLWSCMLMAEWHFNRGCTIKAYSLVSQCLEATPSNRDKRLNVLKAKAYHLLGKLHLLQHDASRSYGFLMESRNQLDISSIASLVPLDLLDSLHPQAEASLSSKSCSLVAYPHSNWAFQAMSLQLLQTFSNFYLYSGQAFAAQQFVRKYLKISRTLGLPGPSLLSKVQVTEVMLKSAPQYDTHIEALEVLSPSPTDLSTNLVQYLAEFLPNALNTRVEVLSIADIDLIGPIFGKDVVLEALSVLSDVQACALGRLLDNEFAVNYSSFVRAALHPSLQGCHFRSLRAKLFRKQAEHLTAQSFFKEAVSLYHRALVSIGCCPSYPASLLNGLPCCADYSVSPQLTSEFILSGLGLAEILAKENKEQALQLLKRLPDTEDVSVGKKLCLARLRITQCDDLTKAYHVFKSIGQGYTTQLLTLKPEATDPLRSIEAFRTAVDKLPWTVIAIGCEALSRSLVISRVTRWREPVTIDLSCSTCGSAAVQGLVEEFGGLMQESASSIKCKGNSNRWWTTRERIDINLKTWLESFQQKALGKLASLLLQGAFADPKTEQLVWESAEDLSGTSPCCRQQWKEAAVYCILSAALQEHLSYEDLRGVLTSIGLIDSQEDIFTRLRSLRKHRLNLTKKPLILLIDSNLLHLPWECLPALHTSAVTRVPSFSLLMTKIDSAPLNLAKSFYILNPSKDLESTQSVLEPLLTAQPHWRGVVGEAPQEADFKRALCEHDLLVYCGHSGGEQYLKADKLKELKVTAKALLMGCSSGLLQPSGLYEPQGIVVAYLLAGSSSVVANLWDVTDKDIDRFTLEFLRRLTQNTQSIELALASSRHACKLKSLIGCAPVCYGVPSLI